MSEPPFVMSMFASKADLYEARSEYFRKLLLEAVREYASKNDLSEIPTDHWADKALRIITEKY